MDAERAAAKRRASFGRADRLRKEKQQKAEQTRTDERRKAERDKADQERKAAAVKAAEQRIAQSRKKAELRRLERHKDNLKKEFTRKAESQKRQAVAEKAAEQKPAAERDPRERNAAAFVAQQEKRQLDDQQKEHRRQTDRLRADHRSQRLGFSNQRAAAIINHARQIRNIDIAERRELEAFDAQRGSLRGRVTGLVRGAKHFERQERAIVERHENDRWQKHREHEGKKEGLFWSEQTTRLRWTAERAGMAKAHQTERQQLSQAQERARPQRVKDHMRAMDRLAQIPVEQTQKQENVQPTRDFGQAACRNLEIKR